MSKYHHQLQIFLYKNKLNEQSITDLLGKFSTTTVKHIINDLGTSNVMLQGIVDASKDSNELYIFSDGNCRGNGKKYARAGYSAFFTDNNDSPYYKFNKTRLVGSEPTNNKAELSGIKYIFKTILENQELFKDKKNIICTDSMYSINCIDKWSKSWSKNGWKNSKGQDVKNKELIQGILNSQESINQDIKIIFKHVPAHMQEPNDKKSLEWIMWYGNNKVDSNINELLDKSKDD
jgi:ribonuclease HI